MATAKHTGSYTWNIMKNKSRLWWFGLVILEMGLLFFISAFSQNATINFLSMFSANSLMELSSGAAETIQLLVALTGCVMAAWGLTLMAISFHYTKQVRNYAVKAMILWFTLDTIASLAFGFAINAVLNLGFLIPGLLIAMTAPLSQNNDIT